MNIQDLFTQLSEIRKSAVAVIKDIMASISTTDINVCEYEPDCITFPPLTHDGDEPYVLASISLCPDGHLIFESDSEFNTITDGEDDLSADVLLDIAQWMEGNKETFANY